LGSIEECADEQGSLQPTTRGHLHVYENQDLVKKEEGRRLGREENECQDVRGAAAGGSRPILQSALPTAGATSPSTLPKLLDIATTVVIIRLRLLGPLRRRLDAMEEGP